MKIAIATVQVPFYTGGAELLTQMLKDELNKRGHQSEIVSIPFKWYPTTTLLDCMIIGRMVDLTEVNGEKIDRVIGMKFPAFYCKHPNKVLWIMHQHRQAYDLWNTEYGDIHKLPDGEYVRELIRAHDIKYINEAQAVFTIAQNTSERLRKYNGIESETLYHPPLNSDKMRCDGYGDYFFYPSRIGRIKRQRLMVEAARYTKSGVKMIIAGSGEKDEIDYIKGLVREYKLENKVEIVGFISEEEKLNYYANCLGVYFGAFNEDYGYITLESFFSQKPVIVHTDSGGPLEFVINGESGLVCEPDAKRIAEKMDSLYEDKHKAQMMGEAGYQALKVKNMNWDYVIDKLLC